MIQLKAISSPIKPPNADSRYTANPSQRTQLDCYDVMDPKFCKSSRQVENSPRHTKPSKAFWTSGFSCLVCS